jgi:hypothetical protein
MAAISGTGAPGTAAISGTGAPGTVKLSRLAEADSWLAVSDDPLVLLDRAVGRGLDLSK